jgi:hypothetical protein
MSIDGPIFGPIRPRLKIILIIETLRGLFTQSAFDPGGLFMLVSGYEVEDVVERWLPPEPAAGDCRQFVYDLPSTLKVPERTLLVPLRQKAHLNHLRPGHRVMRFPEGSAQSLAVLGGD